MLRDLGYHQPRLLLARVCHRPVGTRRRDERMGGVRPAGPPRGGHPARCGTPQHARLSGTAGYATGGWPAAMAASHAVGQSAVLRAGRATPRMLLPEGTTCEARPMIAPAEIRPFQPGGGKAMVLTPPVWGRVGSNGDCAFANR